MSTKNTALVAAAALALGVVVAAAASPVCENLLNDVAVTQFGSVEVDDKGRVLVIVSLLVGGVTTVRPVADSQGNVKLFGDANAAVMAGKRANLSTGVIVKFVKFVKAGTVGDPIGALKSKFKGYKGEAAMASKQLVTVQAKQSAAQSLGWDTAVGTPENAEFKDLQARGSSITEWKSFVDGKVIALAASLTAAGIDPLTVI